MRLFLPVLLLLGSLAGAAQVTLREGEAGQLGTRRIEVLRVEDRRCGPTEDCPAYVAARVRIRQGTRTSLLTLQTPEERLPNWSGVGVAAVTPGTSPRVTLTDQPPGSGQQARTVTLRRGESAQLGPRRVKLLGLETRRCSPTLLCVRPAVTSVYVEVRWGKKTSWLALEYPGAPAWPGLRLVGASAGPRPALTFSDQPR